MWCLAVVASTINHTKKAIRKESCWTISNITAGTRDQIQAVLDNGLIPPVIHLLQTADFDIKKEAAWVISNATAGGSPKQMEFLIEAGCIPPLVEMLTFSDSKIIGVALEAIENMLRIGKQKQQEMGTPDNVVATLVEQADGLTKIEQLQEDHNEEVYEKVMKIWKATSHWRMMPLVVTILILHSSHSVQVFPKVVSISVKLQISLKPCNPDPTAWRMIALHRQHRGLQP